MLSTFNFIHSNHRHQVRHFPKQTTRFVHLYALVRERGIANATSNTQLIARHALEDLCCNIKYLHGWPLCTKVSGVDGTCLMVTCGCLRAYFARHTLTRRSEALLPRTKCTPESSRALCTLCVRSVQRGVQWLFCGTRATPAHPNLCASNLNSEGEVRKIHARNSHFIRALCVRAREPHARTRVLAVVFDRFIAE